MIGTQFKCLVLVHDEALLFRRLVFEDLCHAEATFLPGAVVKAIELTLAAIKDISLERVMTMMRREMSHFCHMTSSSASLLTVSTSVSLTTGVNSGL